MFLKYCVALCGLLVLSSGVDQQAFGQQGFATTWKTNNLGISAANQITVPESTGGLIYHQSVNSQPGLTNQNPEIEIYQNKTLISDNGVYNMGAVEVGGTSKAVDFDIRNTGTGDLILTGQPGNLIQIAGHNPNDFTITQHQVTSPIAPQDSRTFQIRFHPAVAGARSAVIFMQHNATGQIYRITLVGNGQNVPDIHLRQGTTNLPSGSNIYMIPRKYDFSISNTGTAKLIIGGAFNDPLAIYVSGTHARDFKLSDVSYPQAILPGQETGQFSIQFIPSGSGIRTATLTIRSNDPDEDPYIIHLIGNIDARPILETAQKSQMLVSPNPTTDQLTLSSEAWQGQNVLVNISNMHGRLVATQTIKQASSKIGLNVSKYKAGWYVLTVSFGKTRLEYRFLKR